MDMCTSKIYVLIQTGFMIQTIKQNLRHYEYLNDFRFFQIIKLN